MKYLQDYMEAQQTALFEKTNTIFAFSTKQFNEQKIEGVTYVNMGAGMICDETHVPELIEGLDAIHKSSIAQDLLENGKSAIIVRELYNHEAFYTRDITATFESLEGYGFTKEDVMLGFRQEERNAAKSNQD